MAEHPIIFTNDRKTADKLKEEGFPLISETTDGWTFLNQPGENLRVLMDEHKGNISVTDRLCI